MPSTRRSTIAGALVGISLSTLLLTGCARGADPSPAMPSDSMVPDAPSPEASSPDAPPPDGSSALPGGEACAVATAQIDDTTASLRELQSRAGGDPSAIGPALRDIQADLDDAARGLDDPQVGDALVRAADAAQGLADQVDAAGGGGGGAVATDDLAAAATELQASFTAIGELCG
ncbi:MAG: hypothetical protein RI885_2436 [Actinomycetota bacterium]|jgi:hypothetical protein